MKFFLSLLLVAMTWLSVQMAVAAPPYSVNVSSVTAAENCSLAVAGNVVGTAVTLDFVPEFGDVVRLVTNQQPVNGNFEWNGPIPNYSAIPENSKIRAYTNRLIHVDVTVPACKPPHAVSLIPDTSNTCHQLWTLNGKNYGNDSGSCVSMNSIDQVAAFHATKDLCQEQGLLWFDFNVHGANFSLSNLVATCRRAPLLGDTYYNDNFNTFMNAVMNSPSLFAQFKVSTQAQQIVNLASVNGYSLSISDITFPAPTLSPDRHFQPLSACGISGEEPCNIEVCDQSLTVYFPFNFCCIPEYTTCTEKHNEKKCYGETSPNNFGRCAPANVTLKEAIAEGCRNTSEIEEAYNTLKSNPKIGLITSEELNTFSPSGKSGWVTTFDVTNSKTCAFRAVASSKEIKSLQNGHTISKAQVKINSFNGNSTDIQEFWAKNGPEISPSNMRSQTALALQMLALQSSAKPLSQYSSVALDYQTASSFGDNVYAYYLDPNSPVLGLQSCQLKGEKQYQVPSGTPITELHRNINRNGWEKYDPQSKKWLHASKSNSEFLQKCVGN